jgi:hypothetical protein
MKKIIAAIKVFIIRFRYEHLRNEAHVQAELTIHGKGNYKGEKSLSFHIAR